MNSRSNIEGLLFKSLAALDSPRRRVSLHQKETDYA